MNIQQKISNENLQRQLFENPQNLILKIYKWFFSRHKLAKYDCIGFFEKYLPDPCGISCHTLSLKTSSQAISNHFIVAKKGKHCPELWEKKCFDITRPTRL